MHVEHSGPQMWAWVQIPLLTAFVKCSLNLVLWICLKIKSYLLWSHSHCSLLNWKDRQKSSLSKPSVQEYLRDLWDQPATAVHHIDRLGHGITAAMKRRTSNHVLYITGKPVGFTRCPREDVYHKAPIIVFVYYQFSQWWYWAIFSIE